MNQEERDAYCETPRAVMEDKYEQLRAEFERQLRARDEMLRIQIEASQKHEALRPSELIL